jgi:histidinol-phosphate aminotransferase
VSAPEPTAWLGVGARRGADAGDVLAAARAALAQAGLPAERVAALVTVEAKAAEPGVTGAARRLGLPVRAFAAARLAALPVPHPSGAALAATGTPSVAEAAALAAAGPDATLLVPKRVSPGGTATAALAISAPRTVSGADRAAGTTSAAPQPADASGAPATTTPAPDPAQDAHDPYGADGAATGAYDLRHHGDAEVRDAALTDLAVNVRSGTPPEWLRERIAASIAGAALAAYPDARSAHRAVAARHGRPVAEALVTAGAAEAFVLVARALPVRRAVVVHPQFTEPEAALRAAGRPVERLVLDAADGFRLTPAAVRSVPADADLVVVGNPTNPTSVLHPAEAVAALARPGRTLLVDEAFMDAVPGEPESLADRRDLPGLVVLRSLTKTWGLAGLRVGYAVGDPERIAALREAQPLWSVSTPALAAAEACLAPAALAEAAAAADLVAAQRAHLLRSLAALPGVTAVPGARAPFVLLRVAGAAALRERLRERGFAVRRADTFPGLGPEWLRIAVRDAAVVDRLTAAFAALLDAAP